MARKLRIGLGRSDRTLAIIEGRMRFRSVDGVVECPPHEELFRLAFDLESYDVAELSLSNFIVMTASERCGYAALPIFTSRMFRHATIYTRTDRDIREAADLKGKIIGVREFSNTATVTAKGLLSDVYDVRHEDISWRYGPVNPGEDHPVLRRIPLRIEAEAIKAGECLSDLLASGVLDAIIAYSPPLCFQQQHDHVARLFPDYRSHEQSYFARSGIFPIMHLLGIRTSLADDALLCLDICETFERAKHDALNALERLDALPVMLPWVSASVQDVQRLMGPDYWPYGLRRNHAALCAMLRWLAEQDLVETAPPLATLFAAPSRSWEPSESNYHQGQPNP
jgi:4,5-dihydroxyphthalate decarboxylase